MVYPCTCDKGARHVLVRYHTFSTLALNGGEFNILITFHCLESGSYYLFYRGTQVYKCTGGKNP
jgi:hypothetical protein